MNQRDDLDRTLERWFHDDAATTAPRRLFEDVATTTGRRRPRPAWLATIHGEGIGTPALVLGRPARPLVLLALVGALIVGLIGGALLAGGGRRPAVSIVATPTPEATGYVPPEPTLGLSGGVMPLLDMPSGLNPATTPGSWERHVLALIQENVRQLGWSLGAPRVSAVRLLAPGTTYPTDWVDGLDHGGNGFTAAKLSWAIEAEGTLLACGKTCRVFAVGTFFFDDVSEALIATGASGSTSPIPAVEFRTWLRGFGQTFRPVAEVPNDALSQAAILAQMQAMGFLTATTAVDPVFGIVTCIGLSQECQDRGYAQPGQTREIWWIGLPEVSVPAETFGAPGPAWYSFDAITGEEGLSAVP